MALEDVYRRNAHHKIHRAGWLRAAVLGANDGLVSTASLMIGVSAARADNFLVTAGAAGIGYGMYNFSRKCGARSSDLFGVLSQILPPSATSPHPVVCSAS